MPHCSQTMWKKNVRTKRGVIKGHAHWQHRCSRNLHNKHILLEPQQPPYFMKSNPTQVNDVIWKCCQFKRRLLGPEIWWVTFNWRTEEVPAATERPKCPKIKHDKQGLEGPLCLHSPGCLWEISLNLASDLSGSCYPRKKGSLGIERAKERDKVETYLKDRWSRQKDWG